MEDEDMENVKHIECLENIENLENAEYVKIINKFEEMYDRTSPINALNDDCLRLIFQHLPIIDKIKIERVCKRWQKVSKESWYTFKKLDLCPSTWGWPDNCYKKFIDNDILQQVLSRCSQYLTDVDFSKNNFKILLYYVSIHEFCQKCQKLESLNLCDFSSNRRGFNCPYADSEGLIGSLILHCENLTRLGLEPSSSGFEEQELILLFDKMKKIKSLRLGSFTRALFIEGKCLLHLPSETIEEVVLVKCLSLLPCFFREAFDTFKNLRTLILINCSKIDDHALETLSSHLKTLKALAIKELSSITQEGLEAIQNLKNLEMLNISDQVLSDSILQKICKNCKCLTFLAISNCQEVKDIGLQSLTLLPNLQHLTLSRLNYLTNLQVGEMNSLKYVEMRSCPRLKDDGLCELVQRNQNLELLLLEGSWSVTDKLLITAMNTTKERENNVVLQISTSNTAMRGEEFINTSPLLKVLKCFRRVRGRKWIFIDTFFPNPENCYEFIEF